MGEYAILIASALLLTAGVIEYAIHRATIATFSVRVNVNGTRGKSTVTRLIAAGLRAGGLKTVAKTTGTLPMLILPDGTEEPIRRRGRARISEHIWVAKKAKAMGAEALVVECMALEVENQRIYEHMLVKSTIGVITNIRPDHLDVMGPELEDVAETLATTIPRNGNLVTTKERFEVFLQEKCKAMGTVLHAVEPGSVSDEELCMFTYTSFKDNVAEALKVCELAGVARETALRGMIDAMPDPGVSPVMDIEYSGRKLRIVNAFAANDVESTGKMWDDFVKPALGGFTSSFIVINNREDRPQRVGEMSSFAAGLPVDGIFLIGKLQQLALRMTPDGSPPVKGIETASPEVVMRSICSAISENGRALLFFAGNTKGIGTLLTDFIRRIKTSEGGNLA